MNAAQRLSNATGKNVHWRDYTLLQLAEAEAKLEGVDVQAVRREVVGKRQQDGGGPTMRFGFALGLDWLGLVLTLFEKRETGLRCSDCARSFRLKPHGF